MFVTAWQRAPAGPASPVVDCVRRRSSSWEIVAQAFHTGVCEKTFILREPWPLATQQQELQSSPRFGAFKADFPTCLLIRRSVCFTDTGIRITRDEKAVARLAWPRGIRDEKAGGSFMFGLDAPEMKDRGSRSS